MRSGTYERAYTCIEALIERARSSAMTRLPTALAIAAMARVSQNTVLKCLDDLEKQGILEKKQKMGIRLLPDGGCAAKREPWDASLKLFPSKSDLVRTVLRREILLGNYQSGALLPSLKVLSAQHNMGFRCMKRILDGLVSEGYLVPGIRQYKVRTFTNPVQNHAAIVLIARGERTGELLPTTSRFPEHMYFLERLCSTSSVRLHIVPYYYNDNDTSYVDAREIAATITALKNPILGFFIWNCGIDRAGMGAIVREIRAFRKPISILDEEGFENIREIAGKRNVKVFSLATDKAPGTIVARHLISRGHRSIAFIDTGERALYSMNRLQGIREQFVSTGISARIELVVPDKRHGAPIRDKFMDIAELIMSMLRSENSDLTMEKSRRHLELVSHVYRTADLQELRTQLAEVLGALAKQDFTVWVACNDDVAIECLDFLRTRNIDVPHRISVIGFDDGIENRSHGLTTFNFNGTGLINMGFLHAAGITFTADRDPHGSYVAEGFLVERATTRHIAPEVT